MHAFSHIAESRVIESISTETAPLAHQVCTEHQAAHYTTSTLMPFYFPRIPPDSTTHLHTRDKLQQLINLPIHQSMGCGSKPGGNPYSQRENMPSPHDSSELRTGSGSLGSVRQLLSSPSLCHWSEKSSGLCIGSDPTLLRYFSASELWLAASLRLKEKRWKKRELPLTLLFYFLVPLVAQIANLQIANALPMIY